MEVDERTMVELITRLERLEQAKATGVNPSMHGERLADALHSIDMLAGTVRELQASIQGLPKSKELSARLKAIEQSLSQAMKLAPGEDPNKFFQELLKKVRDFTLEGEKELDEKISTTLSKTYQAAEDAAASVRVFTRNASEQLESLCYAYAHE